MKATQSTAKRAGKNKKQSAKIIQLNIFQQPHQKETGKLIDALWGVASSSLWFNKTFSEKETEQYKELLSEYFFNGKDCKRNFKELIERIRLYKADRHNYPEIKHSNFDDGRSQASDSKRGGDPSAISGYCQVNGEENNLCRSCDVPRRWTLPNPSTVASQPKSSVIAFGCISDSP